MISRSRIVAMSVLTASAFYVGVWAAFFPRAFHAHFPGFQRLWSGAASWLVDDGPYNQHLVRDVGAFYLALGAAGMLALVWRDHRSSVVVGLAWLVFNALHLAYHLQHLASYSLGDQVANVATLGGSLVLSVVLVAPARAPRDTAPSPAHP